MASEEDIAAQQALLQAHRQTLGVLLPQQAQFGAAYVPPAVANGIRAARSAIAQIKRTLSDWGVTVENLPNDIEPARLPDEALPTRLGPNASQVSGDIIVASVGPGAQGIAVGKHIQQTIGGDLAAGQDADKRAIDQLVAQLERELAASAAQLDGATATMAGFQLRLLAGELGKTGDRAAPSASTITQVGDWLLDHVPPLNSALTALFTAPPALRVLCRADAPLDGWRQRRFGG